MYKRNLFEVKSRNDFWMNFSFETGNGIESFQSGNYELMNW